MVQSVIDTSLPNMDANEKQDSNEMPPPRHIGREFVRQYYTMLATKPSFVHRFYSHDSVFIHGEDKPITGQHEIMEAIKEKNIENCSAKILTVDACKTLGDGVVIQVIGQLNINENGPKRFMQTFVLAPQSHKVSQTELKIPKPNYYVYNDIFRYEEEVGNSALQEDGTGSETGHAIPQPPQPSTFIKPPTGGVEVEPRLSNGHAAPPQMEPSSGNEWNQGSNGGPVPPRMEGRRKESETSTGAGDGRSSALAQSSQPPSDPTPAAPKNWASIAGGNSGAPPVNYPPTAPAPQPQQQQPPFNRPPSNQAPPQATPETEPTPQNPRHYPNHSKSRSNELFVGQIPLKYFENDIKKILLEKSGVEATSVRVNKPNQSNPSPYNIGFATFGSVEEVEKILSTLGAPLTVPENERENNPLPKYQLVIPNEGRSHTLHIQKVKEPASGGRMNAGDHRGGRRGGGPSRGGVRPSFGGYDGRGRGGGPRGRGRGGYSQPQQAHYGPKG